MPSILLRVSVPVIESGSSVAHAASSFTFGVVYICSEGGAQNLIQPSLGRRVEIVASEKIV